VCLGVWRVAIADLALRGTLGGPWNPGHVGGENAWRGRIVMCIQKLDFIPFVSLSSANRRRIRSPVATVTSLSGVSLNGRSCCNNKFSCYFQQFAIDLSYPNDHCSSAMHIKHIFLSFRFHPHENIYAVNFFDTPMKSSNV
jgi:hypothetical protein